MSDLRHYVQFLLGVAQILLEQFNKRKILLRENKEKASIAEQPHWLIEIEIDVIFFENAGVQQERILAEHV